MCRVNRRHLRADRPQTDRRGRVVTAATGNDRLADIPQASAMSRRSCPAGAVPSTSPGICSRDNPHAANRSSDQSRRATSSHSVPAESDISDQHSPLILKRR